MKKPSSCLWWTCGGGAAGPRYSISSNEPRVCASVAFAVPMNGIDSPSPGSATKGVCSDLMAGRALEAAPRLGLRLGPLQV
jgi:hypothetical protein